MTYEEAEICLEYHLPVKCVRPPNQYCEGMVGKTYYINQLARFIPHGNRGHEIDVSATLEMNSRSLISVGLWHIEPLNSFKNTVQKYLKNRKKAQFKSLIKEYLEAGATQTRIIEKVKSIIKEIKNSEANNDR